MSTSEKKWYTPARNRATQKYVKEHLESINVRVPKGKREYYKKAAEMADMSLNAFAVKGMDNLIDEMGISVPMVEEKKEEIEGEN